MTLGALALTPVSASAHHGARATGLAEIGPERPARGLIYEDLKPAAASGACAGLLKVVDEPGTCTHGPDPGPRGVDVRDRLSAAELRGLVKEEAPAVGDEGGTAGEASVDCTGNGADGNRVEAIYAHPSNVPNRYATVSPLIAAWAARASGVVDASAAQTGGSRRIRFVTGSGAAGCQLVIRDVTLSPAATSSFSTFVGELRDQGFDHTDRKYLVWMDASAFCGIGQVRADDSAGASNLSNGHRNVWGMVGRVDQGCWGRANSTEVHELVHTLGGVQLSAPHSSGGYHCTDEYDLECYSDDPYYPAMNYVCPSEQAGLLDCNDDDYFSTAPPAGSYLATHWNTANSSFLGNAVPPPPPGNDGFAAARVLSGATASRPTDTNIGATEEPGEPDHAGNGGGASVWYRWTAPSAVPVTISTAGSSLDTLLAVYTGGAVDGLTPVAANDDQNNAGGIVTSSLTFTPVAGETYSIAVDGFAQSLLPQVGLVRLTLEPQQAQSSGGSSPAAAPTSADGGPSAVKVCTKKRTRSGKKKKRCRLVPA